MTAAERISDVTIYVWKEKYGSLGTSEVRELRLLREGGTRKRFYRVVQRQAVEAQPLKFGALVRLRRYPGV
jgi:hypothetical protein